MQLNHTPLIGLFVLLAPLIALANDPPSRPTDEALAAALTDCFNALTAMEGLAATLEMSVDKERLANSKRIARRGAIALVGQPRATEQYELSKVRVKNELAKALESGTPAVTAFVAQHTKSCVETADTHSAYLAERIAEEQRRRDAARR